MAKIIECIPNVSEGRRTEVVEALVNVVRTVPGVTLLDYSSDASHNRSVITMVGDPDGIEDAAFKLAMAARDNIDLTQHEGEHPRMGAIDVIPFVPIKDVTVAECVELSKKLGERIANELGIPVFLYEDWQLLPTERTSQKFARVSSRVWQKRSTTKSGIPTSAATGFTPQRALSQSAQGPRS